MCAQVLQEAWYTVWAFTSPHLIKANERIRLNQKDISDKDFDIFLWKVFHIQKDVWVEVSYFEAVFLSAVLYFCEMNVDYAVIEVGLWWTLDATNVFKKPIATAITSIGFDHTHILWKTRSQIQWNKMWIMKQWVPCYTRIDTKLMRYWARCKWAKLKICKKRVPTNLPGKHQEENAWIAYELLLDIWVSNAFIRTWLMNVTHRGRCERLRKNLLIDGGHNASWLATFQAYIKSIKKKYTSIVTIFWTVKKQSFYEQEMYHHLIQGETNYFVQIQSERACPIKDLPIPFPVNYLKNIQEFKRNIYTDSSSTLYIVYGSLYLMWEIIHSFDAQQE